MDRLLINYLPPHSAELLEVQSLMTAEQPEIERLWGDIDNALKDQFLSTATITGIMRWEKMLKLVPRATDTLDERRFRILARINEQLPFTKNTLRDMLKALCGEKGFRMTIFYGEYRIRVLVELSVKKMVAEVESLLKRVIPANMFVEVSLLYNVWETTKMKTWGELLPKTWGAVKEEVS